MATLLECKRLALLIEPEAFKYLKMHNENWFYYRCMMLFLYGTLNGIHDYKGLKAATQFKTATIKTVCKNLSENGIWKDGLASVDFEEGNEWIEIILCTMCAMGDIVRFQEAINFPVPALPLSMIPALQILEQRLFKETLDEIKVKQIERKNNPYEFQIPKDVFAE